MPAIENAAEKVRSSDRAILVASFLSDWGKVAGACEARLHRGQSLTGLEGACHLQALAGLGRLDEAASWFEANIGQQTRDGVVERSLYLVARAMYDAGRFRQAVSLLDAIPIDQASIPLVLLRANAHTSLGEMPPARAAYDLACNRSPSNSSAWLLRAYHLIRVGQLFDGLRDFARYEAKAGAHPRSRKIPVWSGEPLGQHSLRIYFEYGLGDAMQFSRFLIPLRQRYPDALLQCDVLRPLRRLFEASFPFVSVMVDAADGGADLHCPSTQLPALLQIGHFEPRSGYLAFPPGSAAAPPVDGRPLRVGLVWRGRRGFTMAFDCLRSLRS